MAVPADSSLFSGSKLSTNRLYGSVDISLGKNDSVIFSSKRGSWYESLSHFGQKLIGTSRSSLVSRARLDLAMPAFADLRDNRVLRDRCVGGEWVRS